ncbi:serine acetyltransferase [Vibrio sp. 03_296]|nr:serine acetyltransferase [Vibrio sp. 03_296]
MQFSLAATFGISVDFFSSGYLDVSVLPVRFIELCIHSMILAYASGFPHSEIVDSSGCYCLIYAYRKLLRPSSPLTAKASTVYA